MTATQTTQRRRIRTLFLCGAVALFCAKASLANGQTPRYRIESWTTNNGLPQNSVNAILQTREGYIWLTTADGLVRYDGVSFTVFDRSNTSGMNTTLLDSLFESSDGTLWIGTQVGDLIVYKSGRFETLTPVEVAPDDSPGKVQLDGEDLPLDKHWRYTRLSDGRVIKSRRPPGIRMYVGPSATRWTVDSSGLHEEHDGRRFDYSLRLSTRDLEGIILHEDSDGSLWLGVVGVGLCKAKDGVLSTFGIRNGIPSGDIGSIVRDRRGNVWFSMRGGLGIACLKDGEVSRFDRANGLSSNDVNVLYEDTEGTIWVGTYDKGLNRLTPQTVQTISTKDGLVDDIVYTIWEDRLGIVWIGARGVTKLKDGVFSNFTSKSGLSTDWITSFYEESDGTMLVGAYGRISRFRHGQPDPSWKLPGLDWMQYVPWCVTRDREGAMWIGSLRGAIKVSGDKFTIYTTKDGLPSDDVQIIHQDRRGLLWFGTYGGLAVLKDGEFSVITERDGLGSNRVRAIYEDREGTLWIGTYDGGLTRIKEGKLTTYTVREGLYNNGVFQILEDGRGNFWIGCNRGIYRVSKQNLNDFADGKAPSIACIPYGQADGMLNIECNGGRQPAGTRTRDGRLWFPTQQGVAIIDPETVPFNSQPPPVLIEGCLLNGASKPFTDVLDIDPGEGQLEIRYTGLSFIKPEHVRFKYRIEGLDKDWTNAGNRRVAYYPFLPPGEYTFTVKAANSDGVWSPDGASIRLVVHPPFWRTWWFYLLAALGVSAVVAIVFRGRVSRLERARAGQEEFSRRLIDSQEAERKRIAAELHDSIGQSLAIIKNHALFGLTASPDLEDAKEQLEQISSQSSQAIDEVKEISYNLRPYLLDRLGLTKAIESMLNKVAHSTGIDFASDLVAIDGTFSKEAEMSIYRVVQEAVGNIIKHSAATEVRVEARRTDGAVVVMIADNGRGFVVDQPDTLDPHGNRRGFGLMGMSERARLAGAKLITKSEPGKGTTITMICPTIRQP